MQIYSSRKQGQVLLATAVANIKDGRGHTQGVRLLIDPASQATFMTKACAQRLGLQARPVDVPVLGMGHVSLGICRQMVRCNFQPVNEVELQVDAMVVDHITRAPSKWVPALPPERVQGVHLADPNYNEPAAVDLLLGAEWFGCVILEKPIQGPPGTPSLLKTIWGYCVVGRHQRTTAAVQSLCLATDEETPPLDHLIRRFWEIEEPPLMLTLSPEDQACKELYNATVARQVSGKYVVTLPFKPDYHPLGDSRQGALSRFLALEKRLRLNPTLASLYKEFMSDYLKQGHMKPAGSREIPFSGYYIPHHCIFREDEDGSISKFRVVFNASMATRDGPSLNQVLYKGPKLQKDIVIILLRVRMFEVVVSADVRQMYRNILLTNSQLNFQRIFWRPSPEEPIREYVLTTVTYGVAPAPYLALETMNQLVKDEGEPFPLASEALTEDTYVDDVIKSVPSVETAIKLKEELQQLLRKGGFELRKWMSSREEVLHLLPVEHCAVPAESLSFEKDEPSAKILGLVWAPRSDLFTYKILEAPATATKRLIMSDIGKLFDPVGFVSPVVFIAKCLIRELWQRGIDWDQQPPEEICSKWMRFRTELKELERFSLPRWVHLHECQTFELHGFSDSSEQGYAGVVYLRTVLPNGEVKVSLLMAKSKVAKVKEHSLPRLELCGIELVTRLLDHIVGVFRPFGQPEITVWSDSTVALYWVRSPPHKWKTFVANRVSSCQRRIAPDRYRHVPTKLNPADCASRGMFPKDFVDHDLWKYGPPFLQQSEEYWPRLHLTTSAAAEEDCEARLVCQVTLGTGPEEAVDTHCELIQRFSNLAKLQRVTAWALRFWHNRVVHRTKGIPKRSGPLQLQELNYALAACCRAVQREEFQEDLKALQKSKPGTKLLRNLAPFLDEKGLIRVGGRLRHSGLPYDQKYPVILPRSHPFTNLIIDHYHRSFLHPGLSNLHSIIHRHFWILSARSAISNHVAKCHRCFRTDPRSLEPKMGDLPHDRVNPGKPFQSTGVDYGGPFQIKMSRLRNAKISKAYICLFVCFTTKAVHLELASDLSTEAFLAALRRFVARRGAVSIMYSDCGTNFIGARNQLEGWKQIVQSPDFNDEAARYLAQRNIEWRLNPPASPHFGGLWESGIKSTKRLLARVIGSQLLTFEEFYTVLVQVEATLNSRPLVPLTADPEDLDVLTPGHFLMMEPPGALFERPPPPAEMTVRDRWTLLQQLVASYWKKWSNDYLNTLQRRGKWSKSKPDLKQGMMVLVKELSSPPLHWKIGRVMQTYPGSDGISRVADVKTVTGTYRRSAVNLCPLPDQ